jgi:hypothetical protein
MPIEIAATIVTSLLMPYLKMGADKMAETLSGEGGKAIGEYTVDMARKAWGHIKAAFSSEEEATALEMFEKRPEAAAPVMKEVLEEKLAKDSNLKAQLEELLQASSGPGGQTGAQIIGDYAHLLDMRNAQVSGSRNVFAGAIYGNAAVENQGRRPPRQPEQTAEDADDAE